MKPMHRRSFMFNLTVHQKKKEKHSDVKNKNILRNTRGYNRKDNTDGKKNPWNVKLMKEKFWSIQTWCSQVKTSCQHIVPILHSNSIYKPPWTCPVKPISNQKKLHAACSHSWEGLPLRAQSKCLSGRKTEFKTCKCSNKYFTGCCNLRKKRFYTNYFANFSPRCTAFFALRNAQDKKGRRRHNDNAKMCTLLKERLLYQICAVMKPKSEAGTVRSNIETLRVRLWHYWVSKITQGVKQITLSFIRADQSHFS